MSAAASAQSQAQAQTQHGLRTSTAPAAVSLALITKDGIPIGSPRICHNFSRFVSNSTYTTHLLHTADATGRLSRALGHCAPAHTPARSHAAQPRLRERTQKCGCRRFPTVRLGRAEASRGVCCSMPRRRRSSLHNHCIQSRRCRLSFCNVK